MLKIPNPSLDLVVVTTKHDYMYLQFFKKSMELFYENFNEKWIIVPPQDVKFFQIRFQNTDFNIVSERELIPHDVNLPSWFFQQLIKISAYQLVKSDFFLSMDSDAVLIRDFNKQNVFVNGKAKLTRNKPANQNYQSNWDEWAAKTLNWRKPKHTYQVTPCIFSTTVLKSLVDYCGGLTKLSERCPWTECCLYGCYLEKENLFDQFHWEIKYSYTCGCWVRDDLKDWNLEWGLNDSKINFAIIQSNFEPTINELKEKYSIIFPNYDFVIKLCDK